MQEIKNLVRTLFAIFIGLTKRIFRAIPLLRRVGRAMFSHFPVLGTIYFRLMPPLPQQRAGADFESVEAARQGYAPTPRKCALTPRAADIESDLKAVIRQNNKQQSVQRVDSTKLDAPSPPMGPL